MKRANEILLYEYRENFIDVKCLYCQRTKRDMIAFDRFLNKEKRHSQVIWVFATMFAREYCLLSEKKIRSHCSFMGTFEKTFLSIQMQRHGPIIWVKLNLRSVNIYTQFYLSTSASQTRVMEFIFHTTAIFTEICRCSSWKRCTFI